MADPAGTQTMELIVNGRHRQWQVAAGETLLEALRRHHVKGPKLVCGTGDCCACGVVLNGRSINSCCALALGADGGEVLTVEGMARGGRLHPIQQAFAETGAAQCGFCAPGFIVRSHELLQEHPDPTDEEIRFALAGNICRCTGYVKPVEAVKRAAQLLRQTRL